jgi:hypothetical protein
LNQKLASQVKYLEKQFNDAQSQLRDIVRVHAIPLFNCFRSEIPPVQQCTEAIEPYSIYPAETAKTRLTCSTVHVLDNHVAFQSQLSAWLAPTRVTSLSVVCIKILAFCLSGCALANPPSVRSHISRSGYMRISAPAPCHTLFYSYQKVLE